MITQEKILEILEQNSILSRTAGRVVIYENDWENIAEEIVKNCALGSVVGRSEQLPCDCSKHATYFDEEKKPRCKNCNQKSWLAR